MENGRHEAIIVVPVRMDGKYSRMLLNIEGESAINALMEFYRELNVRYSRLLHKFFSTIHDTHYVTHELLSKHNDIYWITSAYIPEALDEMTEAVQLSYRYYKHGVVDYVGPIFYIMKNEDNPEGQIAYFSNTPPKGDSLYLLNIDNQMEQSTLDQLYYLKRVFDSKEELKIINFNSK